MSKIVSRKYLLPFILVASLFFCWGFAHSILDILNKHFQDLLHISKAKSAYIQLVLYGGYFIMAIPAGIIIRRWGYKAGVLTGLLLYGLGALLFVPGEQMMSFHFFLPLHHRLRPDLFGDSRQSVCHRFGRSRYRHLAP